MASKTVWIVGGLVVAIGVVAYVALKPGPANTETSGTIVEAKRARADGTNSFNPAPTASTTEQGAGDAAKGTAIADAANAADAAAAAGASGDKLSKKKAALAADAALAKRAGDSALRGGTHNSGAGDMQGGVQRSAPAAADAQAAAGEAAGNMRAGQRKATSAAEQAKAMQAEKD